nr:D-alanyl-D-alanine carboxypeptidase family protein [Oikeobacillus pervagus]
MLSFILIFSFLQPSQASANEGLKINADAAILVEAETGKVLYAKNPDKVLGVASMTKMMTEYLVLEAIKEKKIKWDQTYEVSEYVYKVSQDRNLSNVPLKIGEKYTVRELFEAMTIYSANGATIALAEKVAGSEVEFVKLMNKKAKELGLKGYKFVNSSGLNNKDLKGMHPSNSGPEDENVMSARSTAKLAYELIQTFPELLEITSTPKKIFREGTDDQIKMDNWNWMLPSLVFAYEGMDGLKTGTTDFAGFCFTGTAKKKGMRLISVVMNATDENGKGTYNSRFIETKKLLDFGFNQFELKEIFPKNYEVKGHKTVSVVKGKEKEVKVHSKEPFKMVVKSTDHEKYSPKFQPNTELLNDKKQIVAPIKKGETVGYLAVQAKERESLGYLTKEEANKARVEVVTTQSVEKANWFILALRGIGGFFGDVWSSIVSTVKSWF